MGGRSDGIAGAALVAAEGNSLRRRRCAARGGRQTRRARGTQPPALRGAHPRRRPAGACAAGRPSATRCRRTCWCELVRRGFARAGDRRKRAVRGPGTGEPCWHESPQRAVPEPGKNVIRRRSDRAGALPAWAGACAALARPAGTVLGAGAALATGAQPARAGAAFGAGARRRLAIGRPRSHRPPLPPRPASARAAAVPAVAAAPVNAQRRRDALPVPPRPRHSCGREPAGADRWPTRCWRCSTTPGPGAAVRSRRPLPRCR